MSETHEPATGDSQASRVRLVATSGDITRQEGFSSDDEDIASFFETARWTADGTTILTTSSTSIIRGYVLPEDLLSPRSDPVPLSPQTTIPLPEPSNVLESAPYFNLSEPYTNQILVSCRDHPIQLFYLSPDPDHASQTHPAHAPAACYPYMKARSEDYLAATSLIWPAPGSHFIAGSKNMLAKFDASRAGEDPVLRIKTIPSERHLSKGGGVGMRGTVSALSAQLPDEAYGSLVAAGTWTRWVGLYDFAQAGECVSTWSIASAAEEAKSRHGIDIGGGGITQTLWSPCGRYLLISERKSRCVLIYDVRVTGRLLGWLEGRDALGNQRIGLDVFQGQEGSGGFEVWSGASQGTVKVWENVGTLEGAHQPSWSWQGHQATVGSTCLHPSGAVIATCSGSWEFPSDDDANSVGENDDSHGQTNAEQAVSVPGWMRRRNKESSLKIWSLEPLVDDGKSIKQ